MNISKFIAARFDAEQALKLYAKTPTNLQRRAQTQLLGSLAAFVRDITDETPATPEWVEQVTPNCYDGPAFRCSKRGEYTFHQDTDDGVILEGLVTRGRVRLLALAMGLELREEVD